MSGNTYQTQGAVAVLTLDNPPVNGLGQALRTALVDGIDRANADAAVKAIVLIGAGDLFPRAPTSRNSTRRRHRPSPRCIR